MGGVNPGDEDRRRPGRDRAEVESHRVDAWSPEGDLGLSWSVTARPSVGRASFLAVVLRAGLPAVVLVEHDIELPADRWELRTAGLWCDAICETPLEHWSYGLEAFALVIDDRRELLGRGFGERFPLGWELEFEASAEAVDEGGSGYRQPGQVHGLLLLGPDRQEVDLLALRRHWWGVAVPPVFAPEPAPGSVALPDVAGCWEVALAPAGLTVHHRPAT